MYLAHHVVKPRFPAHGGDVDLGAPNLVDDLNRPLVVEFARRRDASMARCSPPLTSAVEPRHRLPPDSIPTNNMQEKPRGLGH